MQCIYNDFVKEQTIAGRSAATLHIRLNITVKKRYTFLCDKKKKKIWISAAV